MVKASKDKRIALDAIVFEAQRENASNKEDFDKVFRVKSRQGGGKYVGFLKDDDKKLWQECFNKLPDKFIGTDGVTYAPNKWLKKVINKVEDVKVALKKAA